MPRGYGHAAAGPAAVTDPFSSLSVQELREIANRLGIPRQVLDGVSESPGHHVDGASPFPRTTF